MRQIADIQAGSLPMAAQPWRQGCLSVYAGGIEVRGKMYFRILLLIALFSTMAAGCATTIPTMAELQPTPAERVFANQTRVEGNAELNILRDKAFSGSAIDYRLFVDGRLSAQLAMGEFVILSIPAGERVIEVRHPSSVIGAVGDSATLRAEPNAQYYYRVNSDFGQIRLLRTTADSVR